MTGSEIAAAVQRYDYVDVVRTQAENSIHLELTNFYDEAWFMLRINDGSSIASVAGGELTQLDGTLYLIRATSDEVDIQLS